MSEGIHVESDSGIARIRIDRPEKKNAITTGMYAAMADALEWIEEDEVDGVGELGELEETLEQGAGAAVFKGEAGGDLEGGEVGAQRGEGGGGVLGEPDVGGAAAEGLDADCAGAGVEIEETAIGDARGEDVEEGLAEAVAGGAGGGAPWGDELAGAMGSGDNTHLLMVAGLAASHPAAHGWSTRDLEERGSDKGEIRGSLHCAADDEAVRRSGRDDVSFR